MRKRWLIALSSLVVGISALVGFWPGESEPEYQGRKLSEWLETGAVADYGSEDEHHAAEAIRAIGTNALPSLLEWIHYDPPAWKVKLAGRVANYPLSGVRRELRWWLIGREQRRFEWAMHGFMTLGQDAEPAVSRLREIGAIKKFGLRKEVLMVADSIEEAVRGKQPSPWE